MPATDRTYWIEHQGLRILYHDFSNIQDVDEAVEVVRAAAGPMRACPPNSVLALTNVAGSRFNKRVLDAIVELTKGNKPFVKASAIVGLSGLTKAAYIMIGRLTGRSIHALNSLDEAKDWLAEQARG